MVDASSKYQIIVSAKIAEGKDNGLQKQLDTIGKNIVFKIQNIEIDPKALERLKQQVQDVTGLTSEELKKKTKVVEPKKKIVNYEDSEEYQSLLNYSKGIESETGKEKFADFSMMYERGADGIQRVTGAVVKLQDEAGTVRQEFWKWEKSVENINGEIHETYNWVNKTGKATDNLATTQAKYTREIETGLQKADQAMAKTKKRSSSSKEVQDVTSAVSALRDESSKLLIQQQKQIPITKQQWAEYKKLEGNVKTANSALVSLGKGTLGVKEQMSQAISKTAVWAAAMTMFYGTIREFQAAIKYITDLNKELINVRIVTGGTATDVAKLANSYNDLAQELGSTTLEVAKGSLEFYRQGKTAEDTARLLRTSTMMSKLANLEAAESTEYMTSMMNGFKLESEDMMGVLDSLIALDNSYATSVGEISAAMSRSSVSAQQAGVSLTDLASYITIISATSRKSAESIGESMKTIFSRLQDVKLGKAFDEEGESISNVETVLNKQGIALRNANLEFRDMSNVLEDLGEKWNTLGSLEQSEIAKAIAGTRQRENFLILMNNWNKVLEAQTIATNSAGLANERYQIYLEGVEAATNRLKTAWEKFWMSQMTSGTIKWFIDATTAIINFTTAIGGLKTVIPIAASLIVLFQFKKIVDGIGVAIASIKAFQIAIVGLGAVSATSMAVATAGVSLLVLGLVSLGTSLYKTASAADKYAEAMDKVSETTSAVAAGNRDLNSLVDLISKYEKLSKIKGDSIENEKAWLEVQNQIVGIAPDLMGSYDAMGNFIIDSNANLPQLIQNQRELLLIEIERAELERKELLPKKQAEYDEAIEKVKDQEKKLLMLKNLMSSPGYSGDKEKDFADLTKENDILQGLVLTVRKLAVELKLLDEAPKITPLSDILRDDTGDSLAPILSDVDKAAKEASVSLESLTSDALDLVGSYDDLSGASMAQVEQLKKMFPEEYIQALTVENGQIKLNIEEIKRLTVARAQADLDALISAGNVIKADIEKANAIITAQNAIIASVNATSSAFSEEGKAAIDNANAIIAAQNSVLGSSKKALLINEKDVDIAGAYVSQLKSVDFWTRDVANSALKEYNDAQRKIVQEQQKAYDELLRKTIDNLKKEKEAERDALKEKLDGYKKIIDAQKAILDQKREEEKYNDSIAEKNKSIADIENELMQIQFDTSEEANARRLELEDERAKAVKDLADTEADHSVETQKDALDKEYDDYKEHIDAQIKSIEAYLSDVDSITAQAISMIGQRIADYIDTTTNNAINSLDLLAKHALETAEAMKKAYTPWQLEDKTGISDWAGMEGFDWQGAVSDSWSRLRGESSISKMIPLDWTQQKNLLGGYHDGGIVGERNANSLPKLQDTEVYAKLLKGEVVANEPQISNFMRTTLPKLVANVSSSMGAINMPLNFNIAGDLDRTVLPSLKSMINDTVSNALKNKGFVRPATSFAN